MADSEITIQIRAEIADLQSQLEAAKQKLADLGAGLNTAALQGKQMGAALTEVGGDLTKLKQLTDGSFVSTKAWTDAQKAAAASVKELEGALKKKEASLGGADEAVKKLHGSTSVLTRELMVLVREMGRGDFTRMAGSMSILATQGLGVAGSMLAIVGAAGLVAAGLGYLAYQAVIAAESVEKIHLGAEFAGNLWATKEAIDAATDSVVAFSSKSRTEAREAIQVFTTMPGLTQPAFNAMIGLLATWSTATGEDLKKTAEAVRKMCEDGSNDVIKYATQFGIHLSPEMRAMADQAERSGSSQQVLAARLEIARLAIDRSADSVAKQKAQLVGADVSLGQTIVNWINAGSANEGGASAEDLQTAALERQIAALGKASAEVAKYAKEVRSATDDVRQLADAENQRKGTTRTEHLLADRALIEQEKQAVIQLQAQFDKLNVPGAPAAVLKDLTDRIQIARDKIADAQKEVNRFTLGPLVEQARAASEHLAVGFKGTAQQLAAAQAKLLEQKLADLKAQETGAKGEAEEELRLQEMIDQKKVASQRAGASAATSIIKEKLSEIKNANALDHIAELQADLRMLAEQLANHSLSYKQRLAVETEYNNLSAQLKRALAKQDEETDRETTQTQIAILRSGYTERKAILAMEVKEKKITVDEEYAQLRDMISKEIELQIELYNEELKNDKLTAIQKLKLNDDILKAKADLNAKLAVLDRQRVDAEKKAAEESRREWKAAFDGIESAATGEVGSLLRGQETYAQAATNIAEKLVEDEIRLDAKWLLSYLGHKVLGLEADETASKGGLLAHLVSEIGKEKATSAGVTARAGMQAGESTAANVAKGTEVVTATTVEASKTGAVTTGSVVRAGEATAASATTNVGKASEGVVTAAIEGEKTGAVAVGETTRTGIKAGAAATGLGIDILTGIKDVMISAYRAAAGAYAAIASIPYVGPVLAPAAAAGALAAVVVFAKRISSAEGGWGEVPSDGMMTSLHKQEMVLPSYLATPLRAMLVNTPSGGFVSNPITASNSATMATNHNFNVTFSINAIDTQSGMAFIKQNASTIVNTLKAKMRNGTAFA